MHYILPPCLPPGRWKGGRAEGGGQTSGGGRWEGGRAGRQEGGHAGKMEGGREREGRGRGRGRRRKVGRRGREGTQVEWRGRREGGREGWGRGGRRKFYLRAELIKCIDPNEGEALKRGREGRGGREGRVVGRREGGREGWGRGGRREFYVRAELIKCIDHNEGEALRRGAVERGGRGRGGWKGGEGQGRGGGRKFYLGGWN